ncbi:MAG: type V CRISPR-associated protein Cas12b, partial [Thermogutta sp.]
ILSRLPGLRVLSVDLGHRYAAACAVWEAVSAEQVRKACLAAGHPEPKASDLYLHLKKNVKKQKKGKEVEVEETTVYRRIGADTLPDGRPHPAPWARLDRQFLIKLQGEEEGAREASNQEIWKVHQLEAELGRTVPIIDRLVKAGWGHSGKQKTRLDALRNLGWIPATGAQDSDGSEEDEAEVRKPSLSVDELMSSAVRTMRLALKRHGDRARIAFAMTAAYKPMPGDRKYYFTEAKELSANDDQATRENKHIEFIKDALMLWHGLASSRGWRDDAAAQLWDEHIAALSGYQAPEEIGEDASSGERKRKQRENREKLHDVAKALAEDATLRQTLHEAWKTLWEEEDERWKKRLRWLKDWLFPRGKAANDPAIRRVGGLSLSRLATLTEFRRVQVAFFTRLHPDGTKTETKEQFGQSALDALDHLREQRVKQLVSRIVEAALGIGRMRRPKGGKDPKRPDVRVDEPCHAIVIEDLTHYRPEETRTRRENRQLMSWSASKIKKYLAEACQLYGLHLREVSAGYTSRQDSRTGAPGIRCQDVPVKEFMQSPFWRKQVAQAEKKQSEGKGDARDRFLCELNAMWKDKADWEKAGTIRLPLKGGEIFVSADPASPAANGLQADLNAAANIGLKALMDPDWPGKWWYVPCEPGSFKPSKDNVEGSAAVKLDQPLRPPAQAKGEDKAKKQRGKRGDGQSKKYVNLWRDISSFPLEDTNFGEWKQYADYQNEVQDRVVRLLKERMSRPDQQPQGG